MNIENITALSSQLQYLLECEKLLQRIAAVHDPYTGEINLSDFDKDYSNKNSLCSDLRRFYDFDDSE